eukprot:jgi/Psemu1/211/gm1.211_g
MSLLLQALQKDDVRTEILNHLTLSEIHESLRGVSQETRSLCDDFKLFVVDWLSSSTKKENRGVLIIGLTSERGKLLNGRIGRIRASKRPSRSGRFPIEVDHGNWISGESETLGLKLCNLHVLLRSPQNKDAHLIPSSLMEYSSTSRVLESHMTLLVNIVLFGARWFAYKVEGTASGIDFGNNTQALAQLPSSHPVNIELDSRMFDYWNVKPFRCSRARREKFGTAIDFIFGLAKLNFGDLDQESKKLAKFDKLWGADGHEGKNMMRNFFHCMKSWKEEHVRGGFWVTDVYKTGTVMVYLSDFGNPESFSTVYLVKGHADIIGNLVGHDRGLPRFCHATILPLYDFWTYSGMCIMGKYDGPKFTGETFRKKLKTHVLKAIYSRNVSWRGPSAEKGLWDFKNKPPPMPTVVAERYSYFKVDWHDGTNGDDCDESTASSNFRFRKKDLELARQIAKTAAGLGGTRKLDEAEREGQQNKFSALTVRRLGLSYEENPNGICSILDSRVGSMQIHVFHFNVDHNNKTIVPTYTLGDVLWGIFEAMKKSAPLPFVSMIMADDRTILPLLDQILIKAFAEEGLIAPIIDYQGDKDDDSTKKRANNAPFPNPSVSPPIEGMMRVHMYRYYHI